MPSKSKKRSFQQTLRSRAPLFGGYVLTVAVFAAVFFAFDLSRRVLVYAIFLSAGLFLCMLVVELLCAHRKAGEVERAIANEDAWPAGTDPVYVTIAAEWKAVQRERQETEAAREERQYQRDRYTTMWAHQIKTPIAALYLLAEETPPKPAALKQQLLRLEEYVDQMLGYERLESMTTDYLFRPVDPEPLLRKSIRRFAPLCIHRRIAVELGAMPVRIITDEKWFSFLFEQIFSNAVKYTKDGIIRIEWDEDALRITDSGIGIPPEDLPRIFEMGFTGRNGRVEKRSTGIGLALSRRIAEALNATLRVESEVGKGTVVTVRFPKEQRIRGIP